MHAQDRYRAEIDGLRAIAVLAVVTFHTFPSVIRGGFIGVDVFFVISGYLISGIIYRDLDDKQFSLSNFYARRFRRIFPALFLVLILVWFLGWKILLAGEFQSLGNHVFAGATFVSNILLWRETGYFDSAADLKPLLHLWSLGVEEQFYLTWPILLVLWRRKKWNPGPLILILFSTSFFLNLWRTPLFGSEAFYLLHTRYWELMIGAGLAFFKRAERGIASLPDLKATSGLLALGAGIVIISNKGLYPGFWALLPTLATGLVISAGSAAWVNRTLLSNRPLVYLGKISYPFYLWHWPLLSLAQIISGGTPAVSIRAEAICIALIFSVLTYEFVERPVQKGAFAHLTGHLRDRAFIYSGALAVILTAWIGWTTANHQGFPSRYPDLEALESKLQWSEIGTRDCRNEYHLNETDFYCYRTSADPKLIIWGDSHANHLITGLTSGAAGNIVPLIQVGKGNCPPMTGLDRKINGKVLGCLPAFEKDRDLIKLFPRAKVVILSSQIPWDFKDKNSDTLEFVPRDASETGLPATYLFKRSLSRTIDFLEKNGKTVIIAIDVPEMDFDPRTCYTARPYSLTQGPERCAVAMSFVKKRQAVYRNIIASLQTEHPRLKVFDPVSYLCDQDHCYASRNGVPLYRDFTHLTIAGSEYVAKPLMQMLQVMSADTSTPNSTP